MSLLTMILTIAAIQTLLFSYVMESLPVSLLGGMLVCLALLCGFLEDRRKRLENQKKPVVAVEAEVVSHHKVREHVGRTSSVIRCYITFKTTDGQVLEFTVSEFDYEDFDIGETDLLRYRGWQFLSFGVKDKSHIKPIAPLPEEYEPAPEPQSALAKAGEKAAALWTKLTSRTAQQSDEAAPPKDDGILTHELDE